MSKNENILTSALAIIEKKVTPISFSTWFEALEIKSIDKDLKIVYLEVKSNVNNEFVVKTLNNRYLTFLSEAFSDVLKETYKVVVKESSEDALFSDREEVSEKEDKNDLKKALKASEKFNSEFIINPKYTFDNFVVGAGNRYAHAAALAVAESPGEAANPLFIYGGSGLGKTHLIQAIGVYIIENNPEKKVLYTDSENFLNDFVFATRDKKMNSFKKKYRNVDVLIIDDIQFLEGKEMILEEFFYTFNALYQNNKQIIITSDRTPKDLKDMDDRLITRFNSNIIADIQPADYETRVAILLKFAKNMNIEIDNDLMDVIYIISEKIKDNIRELEGAFTRIIFFAKQTGEKINKNFARRILKDILASNDIIITPEKIKKAVSNFYNIKIDDLESSKRTNNIAFPRQIAMYLIREMTDISLPKIGEYFGGRDHTTVIYACNKIESQIKIDDSLSLIISELKDEIKE